MILDVNAYLGHFAFRHLRQNTPDSLLRLMDEHNIERAMVSSISAVTYRNPQPANEALGAGVQAHRDRLIPLAVVNPAYAGWRDDLKTCHEQFGMTGVRLYPKWHHYDLGDACASELIQAATERGMLLSIPLRVEDYRQRSWLVDVPDVPHGEIAAAVRAHPQARFVLVNGAGFSRSPLGRADNDLPPNYWIEISRLRALITNEIGQLIRNLGPERLVFGSGMPLKYPDPALLKIEVLDASQEVKNRILGSNAASLLELAS